MDLISAIKITYDLAADNALTADLTDGDDRLEAEKTKQAQALGIVDKLITDAKRAGGIQVTIVYYLGA